MSLLDIFFPDLSVRYQKQKSKIVAGINEKEKEISNLSQSEFPKRIKFLKEQIQKGESLDAILPEVFALTREASKRTLKQRHFDVQILGGIALHEGKIIEMKTGEGKTLVATLPAVLNAIEGKGVHIVTVNDYLAKRDAVWMGQVYDYLGLTTSCLSQDGSYLYDSQYIEKRQREELDTKRDEIGGFKVFKEILRLLIKTSIFSRYYLWY